MLSRAHALQPSDVAEALGSDLGRGLSEREAAARLARYGPNCVQRARRPPYFRLLLNQLVDPLVALLLAAAAVSVAIGDGLEGTAIAIVLVLNGALGFAHELAAERAMIALREGFTHEAVVVRDGVERPLPAEEVVPGDIIALSAGERVAADARLFEGRGVETDESALTGESLPVAKQPDAVATADVPLAERTSMVYAGSAVTRGRGRALVCATGGETELGRTASLAAAAKPPPTPLERRLGRLARHMVAAGFVLTAVLTGAMLLRGEPLHSAFLVGVAVAVAAVPEGLAATVTAALALGARAMARRNAIVRRLDAIETIGETTVVCTDKTGTLTENQIRVAALRPTQGVSERELLVAAVLASTPHRGARLPSDPLEAALVIAAMERGLSREEIVADREAVHEIPFDSDRKCMTIVYGEREARRAFMKGAPEVVAQHAYIVDRGLLDVTTAWAAEGFRVLAVATRPLEPDSPLDETVEERMELLGVVAFHDPLRTTATDAVAEARRAGVAVWMLTGDHPVTARTISHALGIEQAHVLARATAADKLALVTQLQAQGEVVTVTGDGVNDAPALRRADVGVAMGRSGTEAAREAAAIVLTDDDFSTLVAAIREGRRIADNIRKFVAFLLSANLGEVLVFAAAIGAGLGAPLAVIQVLLVNLVTDGLPALALARDPSTGLTMLSPPRRGTELFGRRTWLALAGIGILVGGSTLAAFLVGRAEGQGSAQTMAFATLALSELVLVFAVRSPTIAAWSLPRNTWLVASVLASVGLVAATVYIPIAHDWFATVALARPQALVVIALAIAPAVVMEAVKATTRLRRARART